MDIPNSRILFIAVLDKDLKILFLNQLGKELLSLDEAALKNKKITSFLSLRSQESLQQNSLNSQTQDFEFISSKGQLVHIQGHFINKGDEIFFEGQDVSELRKTQSRIRQLEFHAKVGYWDKDLSSGKVTWSEEVYKIMDVPLYEDVSRGIFFNDFVDRFIGAGKGLLLNHIKRISTYGGSYDLELEFLTHSSKVKWIRVVGTAIEHKGKIVRLEGMLQDVTGYRENLINLFESQERLQIALAANDMGVWQLNVDHNRLVWDDNMNRIFGLKQSPKTLDEFYTLLPPEDSARIQNEALVAFNTPMGVLSSWFRIQVDGQVKYIAVRGRYAYNSGQTYFIGVNWDITKEKTTEETLRNQEAKIISSARLSSLGEMAGGIAHEINNPLSVIQARSSQLKRRLLKGEVSQDEILKGLSNIESTCSRIVKIINGLKTISRDGEKDPFDKISIQDCINEFINLISEKFKNHGININVSMPTIPLFVFGRSVQIEQVLMNIVNNSYDAVIGLEDKWIQLDLKKLNDQELEIRICDSGPGVPASITTKIFEPFFTTKEIGRGTGIGLSISKSIIDEHSGEFGYWQEGQQWAFVIKLPLYHSAKVDPAG